MRYQNEKEEMIARFLRLYESGMINMFEGNITVRTPDCVLVTPSQKEKDKITPEMIIEMDFEGNILNDPPAKPSSEYRMHLLLYRLRDDINAIVHTHSAYATSYAVARKPVRGNMAELYMFFGGEIPVCSYGTPGTEEICADFPKYFVEEDKDAVLLANHGIVTAGKTLADAYSKAESAEKLAMIGIQARLIGEKDALTDEEKEPLLALYNRNRSRR